MSRRFPSVYTSLAIALLLVVGLGVVPCVAEEETTPPGDVITRSGRLRDAMFPGDDDQPTISGRRRSQQTTTGAPIGPDSGPNAQYAQEPTPEIPASVLRTWINAVQALAERFETTLR